MLKDGVEKRIHGTEHRGRPKDREREIKSKARNRGCEEERDAGTEMEIGKEGIRERAGRLYMQVMTTA